MGSQELSAGSVFAGSMARLASQIIDPEVPEGDTETHRRRVGCRRLRSDLRTCEGILDPLWSRPLRTELKALADLLAPARDAEVLLERLDAYAMPSTAPVAAVLRARRRAAAAVVAAHLRSDRHSALRVRLTAGPRLLRTAGYPALPVLAALAAPQWRAFAVRAAKLRPDDPDEIWHRVRIHAKRARYANDLVAEAGSDSAANLSAGLARVQQVLGDLQDSVVAARTWRELATDPAVARRLLRRERDAAQAARAAWPAAWRAARA